MLLHGSTFYVNIKDERDVLNIWGIFYRVQFYKDNVV